jgi:hypothetical protein
MVSVRRRSGSRGACLLGVIALALLHSAHASERVGADASVLARHVVQTNDHSATPFLIVDKRQARLYILDGKGVVVGSSPILLGSARGDDSVAGIGERNVADVRPHERITPAGRFVGEAGRNLKGEAIVWVDYDAAVSMHRVRTGNPRERRLERLASRTISDNRISYGCINVPAAFFDEHVYPLFGGRRKVMIYVLPETRSFSDVFPTLRS